MTDSVLYATRGAVAIVTMNRVCPQLFMKRSWALAAAYGDALEHRNRIADILFAAGGESRA